MSDDQERRRGSKGWKDLSFEQRMGIVVIPLVVAFIGLGGALMPSLLASLRGTTSTSSPTPTPTSVPSPGPTASSPEPTPVDPLPSPTPSEAAPVHTPDPDETTSSPSAPRFSWTNASPYSCTAEGTIHQAYGTATTLTFRNRTGSTIQIYWLDGSGNRKFHYSLRSMRRLNNVSTTTSTPWLIADSSGECLRIFAAGTPSGSVLAEN